MIKGISIFLLSFFLFSCEGKKTNTKTVEHEGVDVINVTADDADMNTAIKDAKETYPEFLDVLAYQDSGTSNFSIKMKFSDAEGPGEHMWLSQLHSKGDKIYGVLNNEPVTVKSIALGDTLEIKNDAVSDWMYVRNGKMIGGFTVLVLYKRMNEAEKKKMRDELDFEIE